MGTHMDGLNHLQMGDRTYNGFLLADIIEDHCAQTGLASTPFPRW